MPLPRNLLKRGSIEEILSSQKLIDESIEKLKNDQPEDLVPVNDGVIQYVPGDTENINADEIVDELGYIEGTVCQNYIFSLVLSLPKSIKTSWTFQDPSSGS